VRQALWLLLCAIAFTGCRDDDTIYLHYHDLNGWDRNRVEEFYLTGLHTLSGHLHQKHYDVLLNIRLDSGYPYTTLPVLVEIESAHGKCQRDTVQVQTGALNTRKLSVGGLCNISLTLRHDTILPDKCRITLSQVSDKKILPGIKSVGIQVKHTQSQIE